MKLNYPLVFIGKRIYSLNYRIIELNLSCELHRRKRLRVIDMQLSKPIGLATLKHSVSHREHSGEG